MKRAGRAAPGPPGPGRDGRVRLRERAGDGQAIKEAGKTGQIVATCVEAEAQHVRLLKDGVLTACVRQKRALFTYLGVKVLDELALPRVSFTADDRALGINPVAEFYYTGSFVVTRENAHIAAKG